MRQIRLEDKEAMLQLHSKPEVQKYTGDPLIESMAEMEKAINSRLADYDTYGYGRWATFLKDEMEFVGWAGLAYLPEFDEIDIGYRFLPQYWGEGLATEASHAILAYAFNTLGIEKVIAIAMNEHKASIRVMQKIGMEFYKFAPYIEGGEDVTWYQISKMVYQNS